MNRLAAAGGRWWPRFQEINQHGGYAPTQPIDQQRPPRADACDEQSADRSTHGHRTVTGGTQQRIRDLQVLLVDQLYDQPHGRGRMERNRNAVDEHAYGQQGNTGPAGQERCSHDELCDHRERLGAIDHALTGGSIGDHAAEQQHEDRGQGRGSDHYGGVTRRTGQLQYTERDRNRRHRRAGIADQVGRKQFAHVRVGEQLQPLTHTSRCLSRHRQSSHPTLEAVPIEPASADSRRQPASAD